MNESDPKFPLDEFQRWYWHEIYGLTSTRGEWMSGDSTSPKFRHDMVEAAFMAGCEWLAKQSLKQLSSDAVLEGRTAQNLRNFYKHLFKEDII